MIDLFLAVLNHGGAIVLLVAIFGVSMASFALREERRFPRADSDAWIWWQDLQELGFEVHLADGNTWRSSGRLEPFTWRRMLENTPQVTADTALAERLTGYLRLIKTGQAERKHAHCLVDWSPLDRAYQLKLLNGSMWQFNLKSEGLGDGGSNSLAWHRLSSPQGLVFESIESLHAALDRHLEHIRDLEGEADANEWAHRYLEPAAASSPPAPEALIVTDTGRSTGVHFSHACGACGLAQVSIPGGICRFCREAQGSGA